jgi:Tfp pilus assembly protein PilV
MEGLPARYATPIERPLVGGLALLEVLIAIGLLGLGVNASLLLHLRATQAVLQSGHADRAGLLIHSLHEHARLDPALAASLVDGTGGDGLAGGEQGCAPATSGDAFAAWVAEVACQLPSAAVDWAAEGELLELRLSWQESRAGGTAASSPERRRVLRHAIAWPP